MSGTRQNDPVTSGEGCLRDEAAEENKLNNCLAKTQVYAKPKGVRYMADACPVLERLRGEVGGEAWNLSPSKR